jgi:hypothetical protein
MSDHNEDPKTGVALSDGPVRNPDLVLFRKEKENTSQGLRHSKYLRTVVNRVTRFSAAPFRADPLGIQTQAKAWAMLSWPFRPRRAQTL